MKNKEAILPLIVVSIAWIIFGFYSAKRHWFDDKVVVSDTWYSVRGDIDDPFEEQDTSYYEVLEIKDGYVLYKGKYSNHSASIHMFAYMYDKK